MIDIKRIRERQPKGPSPREELSAFLDGIEITVKALADHMETIEERPGSGFVMQSLLSIQRTVELDKLRDLALDALDEARRLGEIEAMRLKTKKRVSAEHGQVAARLKATRETIERFLARYADAEDES